MSSADVYLLLDRSGSMGSWSNSAVSAVNEYLNSLREDKNTEYYFTLQTFDDVSRDFLWEDARLDDLEMTNEMFVPRGMTPLNDAIGEAVTRLRTKLADRKILVILTDGLENCSQEHTTETVKALLKSVEGEGWLVMYLGANQDAFAEGAARGLAPGTTMNYNMNSIRETMFATARATRSYASTGDLKSAEFTDDERKKAVS